MHTSGASRIVIAGAVLGAVAGLLAVGASALQRDAMLLAPFALAAVIDARTRRIPNALSMCAVALAVTAAAGSGQGVHALLGAAVALGVGIALVIGARGAFGAGDVKLLAAAGACVGLSRLPALLLVVSIAGGMAAIAMIVVHRRRTTTMPYAPAIMAGVAWLLLAG